MMPLKLDMDKFTFIKNNIGKLQNKEMASYAGVSVTMIKIIKRKLRNDPNYIIDIPYNKYYFDHISTPNQAYWLGFIAADGGISKKGKCLTIELSDKDSALLQQFAHDLQYNKIVYYSRNQKGYCRLKISSKKMCDDLLKYNITPNKSLTLSPPSILDESLVRHFIRGLFDGDGSFWYNTAKNIYGFKIVGTYEMMNYVKEKMGLTCSVCKDRNYYYLNTNGSHIMRKIGEYLYNDTDLFLKRKRDRLNFVLGETNLGY